MTDDVKKIFVVDDEAIIAFEMADALEDLGFEVVGPSTHLEKALEIAQDTEIDVACLDVNLGKDKTSEPIARILDKRNIPYVFITAYDTDQVGFLSENDRVMRKPVSIAELRMALKSL